MSQATVGYARDQELQRLGDESLALGVLDMVFSTPEWVHRRSETIQFANEAHLRRSVSLDLTIPSPCPSSTTWFDGQPVQLIPIDVLSKVPLVHFDTWTESSEPFPVLTRRQNGELAWRGLVAYGNEQLGELDLPPLGRVGSSLIRQVAQSNPERAMSALGIIERLRARHPQASALLDDDGFSRALWMFANNFMLVAMVNGIPGERRILKFAYEEPGSPTDRRSTGQRAAEAIGWSTTTFEVGVPAFSDCESYHFEAVAPEGIDFVDIVLGDEGREQDGSVDEEWHLGYRYVLDVLPKRAHLATSRTSDSHADQDEFLKPTVSLKLQVSRSGWLRSSFLATVLVSVFLIVSAPFVLRLASDAEDPSSGTSLVTDPAGLMTAVVGLVSLAVIRSGEHPYAASRVRPLRYAAHASALLPIAAAWLIAFPVPDWAVPWGWAATCVLALALSVLLGTAMVRGNRRSPPQRHRT